MHSVLLVSLFSAENGKKTRPSNAFYSVGRPLCRGRPFVALRRLGDGPITHTHTTHWLTGGNIHAVQFANWAVFSMPLSDCEALSLALLDAVDDTITHELPIPCGSCPVHQDPSCFFAFFLDNPPIRSFFAPSPKSTTVGSRSQRWPTVIRSPWRTPPPSHNVLLP